MICIDWQDDDPYQIRGQEFFDDEYIYLDIVLVPCNYVHTMEGYGGDSISSECIRDQEK